MTNHSEYNFTTDERKSRQQLASCTETGKSVLILMLV